MLPSRYLRLVLFQHRLRRHHPVNSVQQLLQQQLQQPVDRRCRPLPVELLVTGVDTMLLLQLILLLLVT